jgi:flagellar basal body-associated protein FliL
MSTEIPPLPKPRPDVFTPIYRLIILLLLAGIVVILFFGLFKKSSLTSECKNAIAKANLVITSQTDIIQQLQHNYIDSVYNDSTVTTVNQQIFRANEYEFDALQIITLQNAALLEISTTCH